MKIIENLAIQRGRGAVKKNKNGNVLKIDDSNRSECSEGG